MYNESSVSYTLHTFNNTEEKTRYNHNKCETAFGKTHIVLPDSSPLWFKSISPCQYIPKTAFSGTRSRDMSTKTPFGVHIPAQVRYNLPVHNSFLLIVFILLFSFVKSHLHQGGIG